MSVISGPTGRPFLRRRIIPLALSAALALTIVGCGSDEAAPALAGCATTSSADNDKASPIAVPKAAVTLLGPGTGSLKVPTQTLDRDSAQQVTLTTTSTEQTLLSPQQPSGSGDTSGETVTLPITGQAPCAGDGSVELHVSDPTADQPDLSDPIKKMDGTTGAVNFTAGHNPTTLLLAPTADSDSQARQAVEQSLVQTLQRWIPLPTTPVGPQARWRSVRTIERAVTVTQTIDATLTSWRDHTMVIEFRIDETPVDNVFRIPGSDQTLTLRKYSMSGAGTVTVDLRRLLPVDGGIEMKGAQELVGADEKDTIVQQLGFALTWKS